MKTAKQRVGVRGSRFIDRGDVVSLIEEHERELIESIATYLAIKMDDNRPAILVRSGAWRKAGK